VEHAPDVGHAVASCAGAGGVHVLVVPTDRDDNVTVHDAIHAAVAAALEAAG